jgi:prevent-host-death family protein
MVMKSVSIQELKATLSSVVASAEAGEVVVITRHNTPVAAIGPTGADRVHQGTRMGTRGLRAVLSRATGGRYLEILAEDRGDR